MPQAPRLPESLLLAILSHALTAYPNEACGFWGSSLRLRHPARPSDTSPLSNLPGVKGFQTGCGKSDPTVWPADNVAPFSQRGKRFEIPPLFLLGLLEAEDRGEIRLEGIYHSHPKTRPAWSAQDQEGALWGGSFWKKDLAWLVVSLASPAFSACLYAPRPSSLDASLEATAFWSWRWFGPPLLLGGVDPLVEKREDADATDAFSSEMDLPQGEP